jgi:hypothetical protein
LASSPTEGSVPRQSRRRLAHLVNSLRYSILGNPPISGPIGLGFRVPMLVVSPFSRGGFVSSDLFDHTSVLRFLETRFGAEVPNLSAWRRAIVGDLTTAFDFRATNSSIPNLPSTSPAISQIIQECAMTLAGTTLPMIPNPQTSPTQESGTASRNLSILTRWQKPCLARLVWSTQLLASRFSIWVTRIPSSCQNSFAYWRRPRKEKRSSFAKSRSLATSLSPGPILPKRRRAIGRAVATRPSLSRCEVGTGECVGAYDRRGLVSFGVPRRIDQRNTGNSY